MSLPPGLAPPAKPKKEEIQCPYLDTIKRHLLDFFTLKKCVLNLYPHKMYI